MLLPAFSAPLPSLGHSVHDVTAASRPMGGAPRKTSSSWLGRQSYGRSASSRPSLDRRLVCSAFFKRGGSFDSSNGDSIRSNGRGRTTNLRNVLLDYVARADPSEVQDFLQAASNSPAVIAAMKQTVSNMVGTLPPAHFQVTIDTVADTLAQLMATMLRTGYMYRSVAYRMELQAALRSLPVPASPAAALPEEAASSVPLNSSSGMQVASTGAATSALLQVPPTPPPSPEPIIDVSLSSLAASLTETGSGSDTEASSGSDTSSSGAGSVQLSAVARWSDSEEAYAPGVQTTRVEGEVCRWHLEKGVERMPARAYIQMLEAQVAQLKAQLEEAQQQAGSGWASSADRNSSRGFSPSPGPKMSTPVVQPAVYAPGEGVAPPGDGMGGSRGMGMWGASQQPDVLDSAGAAGMPWGSATATTAAAAAAAAAAATAASPGMAWSSDLLAYIRQLDVASLAELGNAGNDVQDAMAAFVARLMGTSDRSQLLAMTSEFTAVELSKLLLWLLVVGWSLREREVSWEMEQWGSGTRV